jgi:hypothetical protein
MIDEKDIKVLSELIPKQDKSSVSEMVRIYNKYNTPKLTGCACASKIRINNRKAVIQWFNTIN